MSMQFLEDVIRESPWINGGNAEKYIRKIQRRIASRLPEGQPVALTALQRKVLNHPLFFEQPDQADMPPHNLIIQGATSAGKTLVSEISIIDALEHDGKVIVLVPLKAMVRERAEQLTEDLNVGNENRVYGSSSDYLDHDEHIINGEYEVAVIVYEKYFAFLSQGNSKMLDNCKLIIVDELSMLSKEDRGPKLEMALEITRSKSPDTRIICLATSDCKAKKIADWLHAGEDGIIRCPFRPVALDEHIIRTDGTGSRRHIPSEHECKDEEALNAENVDSLFPPEEVKFEIAGYSRELREREKKEKLLMTVIRSVYQRNPEAKVLVFVASKADTKRYAEILSKNAQDIFGVFNADDDATYKETMLAIDACDLDDDRSKIKELMQRGIAYHNSGVSTNLREIIESEFQRIGSPVKAIVATETLTVGVNMPFDVMIMMDSKVPKGRNETKPLTNQEYRNYIGRAGRLGLSGSTGETYLFVSDEREFSTYWRGYYQDNAEIASALTGTREADKAPYYLSLLKSRNVGRFTVDDIDTLYEDSLAYTFESQRGIPFSASKMLEALERAHLVINLAQEYRLTLLGRQIAPFALSMHTSNLIYHFFLEGANGYGLPTGITGQDIDDDRYLLEILYHICRDEEVSNFSSVSFPSASAGTQMGTPMIAVRQALHTLMSETAPDGTPKHKLWCEDVEHLGIYRILHDDMNNLGPEEDMQPTMRAILIYYWTQGIGYREILNKTGFGEFLRNVTAGDLERLAEVISFHLEAVYASLKDYARNVPGGNPSDGQILLAPPSFYCLQTRVKYGMARDLVELANKHVHGLDRAKLLELGRLAKKRGQSPKELLFSLQDSAIRSYMTIKQRNLLRQRIERRYNGSFDTQCSALLSEQPGETTESFVKALQQIMDWDGRDVNLLYGVLSGVFARMIRRGGGLVPANDIAGAFNRFEWNVDFGEEHRTAAFAVIGAKAGESVWRSAAAYLGSHSGVGRILIVHMDRDGQEEDRAFVSRMLGCYSSRYDLALSNASLALALLHAFKEQNQAAYVLFQFLSDAYGVYIEHQRMNLSMQNYLPRKLDEGDAEGRYYLLASYNDGCYDGKTVTQIENGLLDSTKKECCALPWGDELIKAIDAELFFRSLTLIYLNRDDVIHSKSLTKFMYHMASQHYENCCLLFGSENMKRVWYEEQPEEGHVQRWKPTNQQIMPLSADDFQEIGRRVDSYQAGDWHIAISYAHYSAERPAKCPCENPEAADLDATAKLDRLYAALVDEFGVHRVFYDKNPDDQTVFAQPHAKPRSLAIYRACRFGLFLCNYWTIHDNNNCKAEREEVKKSFREGRAGYLYLTTRGPDACEPDDDNDFTVDISDVQAVIGAIRRFLSGETAGRAK